MIFTQNKVTWNNTMTKTQAKKQREMLEEWHNRKLPSNAFEDDPRADAFDLHGKVANKINSNLPQVRWDLGEYPPND